MSVDVSSLPPDAAQFVAGVISTGKYESAEEVVVTGLRLLEDQERSLSELRREVDRGLDNFRRSDFLEIADEASHRMLFDSLKSRLLAKHVSG